LGNVQAHRRTYERATRTYARGLGGSGATLRRSASHATRRYPAPPVRRCNNDSTLRATLYSASHRHCARILLSVVQTLLHGAFVWLQPRSPVVVVVVESGRDPDPPVARVVDAAVAVGSGQAVAPAVRVNHPAPENRRAAAGSRLRAVRAGDANRRHVGRAAVPPAVREAAARAAAHGRAEAVRLGAAVAARVGERNPRLHV
jgi:hypothetical protein